MAIIKTTQGKSLVSLGFASELFTSWASFHACSNCSVKFIRTSSIIIELYNKQRPKQVKKTLEMRRTDRKRKKAEIKAEVSKKLRKKRRILPPVSQAKVPVLKTRDPNGDDFAKWLKANKDWWKKLRS